MPTPVSATWSAEVHTGTVTQSPGTPVFSPAPLRDSATKPRTAVDHVAHRFNHPPRK